MALVIGRQHQAASPTPVVVGGGLRRSSPTSAVGGGRRRSVAAVVADAGGRRRWSEVVDRGGRHRRRWSLEVVVVGGRRRSSVVGEGGRRRPSPTLVVVGGGRHKSAVPIGICYGRVANNLPPPSVAVNLITTNGISSIRLFNPDAESLQPFSGTGIQLTIGVPNEELPSIATATAVAAQSWLQSNIFLHVSADQIRYLVVGNEVFLKDPFYTPYVIPAILNLHQALQSLNLSEKIKISSAQAASILSNSYPPSSSSFAPNILPDLTRLLQFLRESSSPLMVNVYPYFSYINNRQFVSLDSTLFRSGIVLTDRDLIYDNLFDQTVDAFIYAMEREGYGEIPVVVTETGWPTAGGEAASGQNALVYNGNVVRRGLNNVGTPKRPGIGVEVFLFDLFDENEKIGNEFEKYFGIFGVNGVKSYDLNFH